MVLAGLGVRIRYLKPILQGERKRPVHGAAGRPPPERAPSERARDLGSGREQQATVLGLASAPRPSHPWQGAACPAPCPQAGHQDWRGSEQDIARRPT